MPSFRLKNLFLGMSKKINLTVFKKFFHSGKVGGIILLVCVIISLAIANSGLATSFANFLATPFGFTDNVIDLTYTTSAWVNDGLMAIFFLLVGLEIKRELIEGELSNLKKFEISNLI